MIPVLDLIIAAGMIILLCFSFVIFFGAPFLPTLKPQISVALDLLDLQPGQTMLELGCGDGRVLIAAAKRGISSVGYELNPVLAAIAWLRTRRYGKRVRVVWGNYWLTEWPPADGIFAFLLTRYMGKLHNKVMQYPSRPLKIASFAFTIPGKRPVRDSHGVYLYEY